MHHGHEPLRPDSPLRKMFADAMDGKDLQDRKQQLEAEVSDLERKTMKFGATGQFPGGQLDETDEGEIQFGVACDLARGKVLIDFGQPVAWMATDAEQAISLGQLLIRHGKRLLKQSRV